MSTTVARDTTTNIRKPYGWLKWLIIGGLVLAVVMSASAYMLGRALRPHQIRGSQIAPPIAAPDITMTSSRTGQPVSLSDFGDKFVFVYFGYATCPDVCPATLSAYKQTYNMLSDGAKDNVQFLWITVDPDRDSPEVMEEYISHFLPEFMQGLIPRTADELADAAGAFGSHYEKVDYGSEAGYLMDHTASVALIDPQGNWRIVYGFNTPPEDVAADLEYLIENEIN
jgi:protein SCO1/2